MYRQYSVLFGPIPDAYDNLGRRYVRRRCRRAQLRQQQYQDKESIERFLELEKSKVVVTASGGQRPVMVTAAARGGRGPRWRKGAVQAPSSRHRWMHR
uniref:Uncharacterized protein n=1 Tax=Leersia perrieri TaxID=77586 RepID=A0A0D9XHI6_9ORYZ